MPGKQLTDLEIGRIDGFRSSGKTINEIACIMQRSRKTISRFMKKWRECSPGKGPSHKKRPGKRGEIVVASIKQSNLHENKRIAHRRKYNTGVRSNNRP